MPDDLLDERLRNNLPLNQAGKDLMLLTGWATPPMHLLTHMDLLAVLTAAKDTILAERAERTRQRFDEEDEHFTNEDAREALNNPALPFLQRMQDTYRERRGQYGPSEQVFGAIMLALFPNGLHLTSRQDWVRYGIFHQIVGKLSRYVRDFHAPHVDSIHDLAVYAAMLEAEDRRHLNRPPFNFILRDDDDHG